MSFLADYTGKPEIYTGSLYPPGINFLYALLGYPGVKPAQVSGGYKQMATPLDLFVCGAQEQEYHHKEQREQEP
jgi:hypothetical protein